MIRWTLVGDFGRRFYRRGALSLPTGLRHWRLLADFARARYRLGGDAAGMVRAPARSPVRPAVRSPAR